MEEWLHRIRIRPPATREFSVGNMPEPSIAAGLTTKFTLNFKCIEEKDYHDHVVVVSETGDQLEVPIHGYAVLFSLTANHDIQSQIATRSEY